MKNAFDRHGIEPDEFAEALADAMRAGGATDAEIAQEVMGVHVDAAVPGNVPDWRLDRT